MKNYPPSRVLGLVTVAVAIVLVAAASLYHRSRALQPGRTAQPGLIAVEAVHQPPGEAAVVVPATLEADGRIGKITNSQGLVSLRPLAMSRWTPVCGETIVRPGDWLRTDARGASAVTVQLGPETKLILGPGSLVELIAADQVTLHPGTAEISPGPKTDNFNGVIKLNSPGGQTLDAASIVLVRSDAGGLTRLTSEPLWLAGYKGTTARESLGSLVTTIDGREVPLTIGMHSVRIEIRDQIARTTIEETFVNHTNQQLEGQFHFPLPADASISGFGMWVGGELIEADIVERQRAREIYEAILREKRDPGLLEWAGGNIFKARVYPILPTSEKRIKIVYTQVLPRRGDSFRYRYALDSELLRQNPLRELNLEVTISSTQPLAAVQSATHATRSQVTRHAARVEFSAQNYTPTRDFELRVRIADDAPPLTFIPHERGDDGYFLLLLQPPTESGPWERDIVPDGEPLNLVVLADTSASLDASARQKQAELIAALLGGLSHNDRIQLACCDVECVWATPGWQPADEEHVAAARAFLAKRRSLGWTDLDQAFGEVLRRVAPGTHVVYMGDGVVTNVGADGGGFVQRLTQAAAGKGVTFHAVAVSSSYDQVVLRGMAAIGGGSTRVLSAENGPQPTARDLLSEITRPALKNVQLEFKDLQTARVYPRTLPNIPAGTQQIVLGRYLPGGDQQGEVLVRGTLDGKPVAYRTPVSFARIGGGQEPSVSSQQPTPDDDASFIPRLWARLHLDELLAQGASQQIQDEIINLSEEFHLITPYTSLLVLESDADRERFKVKKRFQIRDGERFFAAGRDESQYQLVQQQMRAAALWRANLRNSVLEHLASLGRDAERLRFNRRTYRGIDLVVPMPPAPLPHFSRLAAMLQRTIAPDSWDDVGGPGSIDSFRGNLSLVVSQTQNVGIDTWSVDNDSDGLIAGTRAYYNRRQRSWSTNGGISDTSVQLPDFAFISPRVIVQEEETQLSLRLHDLDELRIPQGAVNVNWMFDPSSPRPHPYGKYKAVDIGKQRYAGLSADQRLGGMEYSHPTAMTRWRAPLLPIRLEPAHPIAAQPKPPKSTWPDEILRIARATRAEVELAQLDGGLLVEQHIEEFAPTLGRVAARSSSEQLQTAGQWLIREEGDGQPPILQWCDGVNRGGAALAFDFAAIRKAEPTDLPTLYAPDEWRQIVEQPEYEVQIERLAAGQVLLVLRHVLRPDNDRRILIDTAKNTVISSERRFSASWYEKHEAKDFIQVAGVWLPQRIERYAEEGRLKEVTTRKYTVLAREPFAGRLKDRLAEKSSFLTLATPFRSLADARAALAAGQATLEDRLVVLEDLVNAQRWPEATAELESCERLVAGKPFAVRMRLWFLDRSRRNEELRVLLLAEAEALAKRARNGEMLITLEWLASASNVLSASEELALLDVLRPVFARQAEHNRSMMQWTRQRIRALQNAGRADEALPLLRDAAIQYPDERDLQTEYASRLYDVGEETAAFAWLKAALAHPQAHWSDHDAIYVQYADWLREQGRYPETVELVEQWLQHQPKDSKIYQRYYAALVYCGRYEQADQLLADWFKEGLATLPPTATAAARLAAAIATAMSDNNYLDSGNPFVESDRQPAWREQLAATLAAYVDQQAHEHILSVIHDPWRFRQEDAFRDAVGRIVNRLKAEAKTLPAGRLVTMAKWLTENGSNVAESDWKLIAAELRQRWETTTHPTVENAIADLLAQAYRQFDDSERIALLRLRLAKAREESRAARDRELFDALLDQPWTADIERESLELLDKLSDAADTGERLVEQLSALYRWTDQMKLARAKKCEREIERPDKFTRNELAEKHAANRITIRSELSERLAAAARDRTDMLGRWMLVERLHLQVELGRELPQIADACLELLGDEQPVGKVAAAGELSVAEMLDLQLRARLVTMLTFLATKGPTQQAVTERLTRYFDAAIARDPDGTGLGLDGRLAKYALLVALDRPKELLSSVATWAKQEKHPERWQRTLAYLQAELGQLDEAVALATALAKDEALSADDYRQLAQWQQALGRREQSQQSLIAAYKTLDEYELERLIARQLEPWQNAKGPSPGTVDPEVFLIERALMEKAYRPQNYALQLRSFYAASRDFRFLTALAEAVVGQSDTRVYPLLGQLKPVLQELDREATADELLRHVATLRERSKTPVDQRALDLLEMLVEQRAAELQNKPGAHVERAVAALSRAEKKEWSTGEPRLFAEVLAGLGKISQQALSDEVLRILAALHAAAKQGSFERLHIAQSLAEALSKNGHGERAITVLEGAIGEYRQVVKDKLTNELLEPLTALARLYGDAGQFVRGEAVIRAELPRAANRTVASELQQRTFTLHRQALTEGGATSLGSRSSLYLALEAELRRSAENATDQRERRRLIEELCEVYRTSHALKVASATNDCQRFASDVVPHLLSRQTNDYQNLVGSVLNALRAVATPRDAMAFLIGRIEAEPRWLSRQRDNGWQQFGTVLAELREEAKTLGDLEPRLLAIVTAALRRDLMTRHDVNRAVYSKNGPRFWAEKKEDFAKVAEEVLQTQADSQDSVLHVAAYLSDDLGLRAGAIKAMRAADERGLLDDSGQTQLVHYLHQAGRYADSLPTLTGMIERQPEDFDNRMLLMFAHHQTKQSEALATLLTATDKHWHEGDRWDEQVAAALAASCLDCELFQQAVDYYREAIRRRKAASTSNITRDELLSDYMVDLAYAFAGLKDTEAAVEAACEAIVMRGAATERASSFRSLRRMRRDQLGNSQQAPPDSLAAALRDVLKQSPNLDEYVAKLDAEAVMSQADRPIVRKSLGNVYFERKEFSKALAQLRLAAELSPQDVTIHTKLIACYDALEQRESAIEQVLASLELVRRDVDRWADLAQRLDDLGQTNEAERARTSLVEMLPSESEGQTRLAQLRESKDRWDDAIVHWREVARLRKLEPSGLLYLAAAQLHQRQRAAAEETLQQLESTRWPARFDEELREKLPKLREQWQKL